MSLRDMTEWNDWDGAAYVLGLSLGLFNKETHPYMRDLKHVFWTANPIGEALHKCLEELVRAGILLGTNADDDDEHDPECASLKFKWNPAFAGSWEGPKSPLLRFTQEVFKDE